MRRIALLCISLLAFAPGPAMSVKGYVGGYAGLAGCLEGCAESAREKNFNEQACRTYCPCVLTIESSRWKEEMSPEAVAARQERCGTEAFEKLEKEQSTDRSRQ